jgi:hypothetical protein
MIWFFACSNPTEQDTNIRDVPPPNWSASELDSHLEELLMKGMPHAITIRNEYASFLQNREGDCPNFVSGESWVGTWEADCETSQNATFWGTGIFIEFYGQDMPYDMSLQSSFEMFDGERYFRGGGLLSFAHFSAGNEEAWEQNIGGSYQLSDTNDRNAWLQNTSASLTIQSAIPNDENRQNVLLQGGYSINNISVHFENFEWKPNKCTSPKGQLKIRDTSGYWYTLEFSCNSGCAEILWYEESMEQKSCLQENKNLWTQALSIYLTPWDSMWESYP